MVSYKALVNWAKLANGTADDLQRDLLLQLEELLAGEAGYSDSLANALENTYASDAAALGVDEEDGITGDMSELTGRTSAANALELLEDGTLDAKLAALGDAIGKRMLWLKAK